MFQIECTICCTLRTFAGHKAITLARIDIVNKAFFSFKVKRHAFAVILIAPLFINRFFSPTSFGSRVGTCFGMYQTRIHVHWNFGCGELHILIVDLCLTIKECQTCSCIIDHRVLCLIFNRRVNAWSGFHGVGFQRICLFLCGSVNRYTRAGYCTIILSCSGTISNQFGVG